MFILLHPTPCPTVYKLPLQFKSPTKTICPHENNIEKHTMKPSKMKCTGAYRYYNSQHIPTFLPTTSVVRG